MRRKLLSVLLALAMIVSTFASLSVFASETVSSAEITASCDKQLDFSTAYTGKVKVSFTLNVAAGTNGNANINFYLYPKGTDRTAAQAVIQLSGRQFYAQQEHATDRRIDFETDSAVVFEYDLSASQYTVSVNGSDPAGPFNAKGTQANVGGIAWKDNLGSVGTIKNLTVEAVGGTQEPEEPEPTEHTPKTYEVYAADTKDEIDSVISGLLAGDTLIFHEGTYRMNLRSLRSSGTAEKPIVVKGAEDEEQPLILNTNENANLWEIYGNHVVIENMAFENDVNLGVRLCQNADGNGLSDVTVQNCTFIASNEIAVAVNLNDAVYKDIRILNNDFIGLKKTAIYIGSHSGSTSGTGIEVRGNFFDGRDITDPNVTGYALELKKNIVGAIVEDNLFINPKGPAIATYGSDNDGLENANIIRHNIVGGSRENCGIIVCAGPAVVQNNIALCNEYIGIGLQNYNGWNMLRDILMTGNTSGILYDPTCPDDYTGLAVSDEEKNITVEDNLFYKELPAPVLKKFSSVLAMSKRPAQENLDAAFALMKEKDTDEAMSVEELTAVLDALLGKAAADTNGDGSCDFGDVAEVMKYFNWEAEADYAGFVCSCGDACYHESDGEDGLDWNDAAHADVNGDGIIDIVDISLILDAINPPAENIKPR